MQRRRLLALVGAGVASGLAGCQAGYAGTGQGGGQPTTTASTPRGDVELPVPRGELFRAVAQDQIPAITEPAFAADWQGLDIPADAERGGLTPETAVVGVERGGRARAYPLAVLDWHEVVNDTFDGPLLVTYCPLCGSAVVAERTVRGSETTFGVSGFLWRNDLVMYDAATESLWSQLLATAIRGPATGETLSLVPSTLASWGAWRERHPDTEVLLPPPASNTVRGRDATFSYFDSKYNYEQEGQLIGYDSADGDLTRKTLVVGIEHGGVARAYPFPAVREADVVNDSVGGLPVVVTVTENGGLAAYVRRVGGTTRRFAADGPEHLRAAGSRWTRTEGRAVSGPHEGTELAVANDVPPLFWTGWEPFHPDTEVYGMKRPSEESTDG